MTTIAALAVDGVVHMAADSFTNVYDRPIVGAARKIRALRVGDEVALLGFCGDGGLADLVDTALESPEAPDVDADQHPWAVAVARSITDIAVGAGFVEAGRLDGSALLGWRGRVWSLTHNQAIPIPDGVAAVGSGEGPAMGALDVLRHMDVDPAYAVRRAVEIACARNIYSEPPVLYLSTAPRADASAG